MTSHHCIASKWPVLVMVFACIFCIRAAIAGGAAEQAVGDPLLEMLDADFATLSKLETDGQSLRDAARLLEETNQSDHWTSYAKAVEILRQSRSKAGVPLLLKYMVKHAGFSTAHVTIAEYADTLTILTGKDVSNPYSPGRAHVDAVRTGVTELVSTWWEPDKDKITTDLGKMTPEQLSIVTSRLLKKAAWSMHYAGDKKSELTAYRLYHAMTYEVMRPGSSSPRGWYPCDLNPAMVSPLLATCGYEAHPSGESRTESFAIPYAAVGMLASLRQNGGAKELDKIAEDPAQNSAVRLTCILALYDAQEDLDVHELLKILGTEKNIERRLVVIFSLSYGKDKQLAGNALMEMLDDPNREIRTAAICALSGPQPPAALPKLKHVIDELDPDTAVLFAIRTIGQYKTPEACQILADFLAACATDGKKAKHVSEALSAIETASGHRFIHGTLRSNDDFLELAKQASAWSKDHGSEKTPR